MTSAGRSVMSISAWSQAHCCLTQADGTIQIIGAHLFSFFERYSNMNRNAKYVWKIWELLIYFVAVFENELREIQESRLEIQSLKIRKHYWKNFKVKSNVPRSATQLDK